MSPSSAASSSASSAADQVAARLATVRARIDTACREAGRDPARVTLTLVSKTQSPEAIDAALAAGQTVFGENRVQEAAARWTDRFVTPGLSLRLIGPLQTNKAADALALFDVIETLDRPKLAHALADAGRRLDRTPRVLVQVNTGAEAQKAGVALEGVGDLIRLARDLGLTVEGLMCIPPVDQPPEPHFRTLVDLAQAYGLKTLSMGMSGDFEAAVRLGATHVRVGSAVFGERKAAENASKD